MIHCWERIPSRMVLGAMLFWSALTAFMLRSNLSLSIVTMVGKRLQNGTAHSNSSGCAVTHNSDLGNVTITTTSSNMDMEEVGEFDWSESTQGVILSAFFWGYLLLQLPGGRLAELIGGRRVIGTAMLISSLLSAITPPLTRIHYGFLVAIRAGQGLCLGVLFPTKAVLVARWVPMQERSRFISICTFGGTFGLALIMPLCGLIIAWFGWAALFYLCAAQGLVFTVCWFLLVHDSPQQHPRISHIEKQYIERGLVAPIQTLPVPWKSILTSAQVWAQFVTAVGSDWGFYTILTLGPKYLASILGVNMKQNGVLSALPFLCRYIFGVTVAQIVDLLLKKEILSLICLRKIAVCISHLLPAVALVVFPLAGCDMIYAVALLCVAMACNGAISSGHIQSYYEIAPNFAGTLSGFTNGLCTVTGIISPLIIGAILERDASVTGWILAFALSAAFYATCSVPYLLFYTAQVQGWNDNLKLEATDKELKNVMDNETKSKKVDN